MTEYSFNLITRALQADDLDRALNPIMDALGLEGDVAAQMFGTAIRRDWPHCSQDRRRAWLLRWLRAEVANA